MIELSVVRDLIAIFGVIAGFSYYVLTVRNAQRTRELSLQAQELSLKAQEQALETRQVQLFMSVYRDHSSKENLANLLEIASLWEWQDYDDFISKYFAPSNLENNLKFASYMTGLEGLGVLVRRGYIDVELLYDLNYGSIILSWEKLSPIIKEYRERIGAPQYMKEVEYLYNEMVRVREERGHPSIKLPY